MANPDAGEDTPGDQVDITPDAEARTDQDGAGEQATDDQSKLIFGKYKTIEEAEKGYKESERKFSEQAQSVSELKREMESLKSQAELKSVLSTVTELVKSREAEKKPAIDFETFATTVGQELADNPREGVRKIMSAISSWQAQEGDKVANEIRALKEMFSSMQSRVEERVERADPFYEKNRELIDRLTDGGMKLDKAKSFVREMAEKAGDETRTAPPPNRSANRTPPEPTKESYWESPEERAQYVAEYGEEITKKVETDFARRLKAEQEKARK